MGDEEQKGFRVERGEGEDGVPEGLIVVPLEVGSMGAMDVGGSNPRPGAMTATVDFDAVPGLQEAVAEHIDGRVFDITTSWQVTVPDAPEYSPIAYLSVRLPEVGIDFHIALTLDEYKRSLMTAARTGKAMLFEPALGVALRTQPMPKALEEHLSIAFSLADPEPLRRALLQRFNLPLEDPSGVDPQADGAAGVAQSSEDFIEGAKPADLVGILTGTDLPPTIVLVDPDASEFRGRYGAVGDLRGRWAVAVTEAGPVARFDCLRGKERIGSWLLSAPPQELVRATSWSPHGVFFVAEPPRDGGDGQEVIAAAQEGLPVLVEEPSRAMRALLEPDLRP